MLKLKRFSANNNIFAKLEYYNPGGSFHPSSTIYSNLDREKQKELGVNLGLIKVSVGIENSDDIIKDFRQALNID